MNALAVYEREHLRRGLAQSTLKLRRNVLRRFLHHANKSADQVVRDDLRDYLAARQRTGVAARTQHCELACLRAVFAVLVEAGLVADDPTADLQVSAKGPPKRRLVLSRENVRDLLAVTEERTFSPVRQALSLRDRALLELLYGLGLRASETSAARVLDLCLRDGTLFVRRAKGGTPAVLPLPPACLPHLATYLCQGRPVLARQAEPREDHLLLGRTGQALSPADVGTVVRRIARRAGLRAHPHAFRRSLASHLVEEGASLEVVRLLLGHTELETTARYVSVDRTALRRAVRVLDWERPPTDSVLRRP